MLDLPEEPFTYIGRPWESFAGRFQAISDEIDKDRPEGMSVLDIGSCSGYFCLQIAHRFKDSLVIGLEGSVGIGNGTIGVETGSPNDILLTPAVKTHLQWTQELDLKNCHLAPEAWTYETVCKLHENGLVFDTVLLLSVIHHLDGFSLETNRYLEAGFNHLEGTLDLTAKLLHLGACCYIELPDRPWLNHVYDVYKTQHNFLLAACRRAFGEEGGAVEWSLEGPIYSNQWYGTREIYLVRRPVRGINHNEIMTNFPALLPWRDTEIPMVERPFSPRKADSGELQAAHRRLHLAVGEAQILLEETRRQRHHLPHQGVSPAV